jgi:hypothetical protein
MIVKLISDNKVEIPENIKRTLNPHSTYKVLSILFKRNLALKSFDITIRILSDDGVPAMYDMGMFKIIDSNLDPDFVCKTYEDGDFALYPLSMSYLGFWEDFFNDEEKAIMTFKTRFPELKDKLF